MCVNGLHPGSSESKSVARPLEGMFLKCGIRVNYMTVLTDTTPLTVGPGLILSSFVIG